MKRSVTVRFLIVFLTVVFMVLSGIAGERLYIQLFRERLSDKVHATTSKGIVGGFEFTVFQRNLIEWQERPWTYACEC